VGPVTKSVNPAAASRGAAAAKRLAILVLCGVGLGLVAAAGALASGFGYRLGWWSFRAGFTLLAAAAGIGTLAALVSLAAMLLSTRARAGRSLAMALAGLALGAATAAIPAWNLHLARSVPPIHDITTDTADPPAFVALAQARAQSPSGVDYEGEAVAAAQKAAYPDIGPAHYRRPPDQVFEAALSAARDIGLAVAAADPGAGRIEATATTRFYGFKDDVVVRIAPAAGGSRVDVRSASRVGKSDLGANARRIRAFLRALNARLSP